MSDSKNYILHFETATKVCSVALSCNGKLVQLVETSDDAYSHGENLTLFADQTLKNEGIEASQLTAIAVTSGPGSYTGLRIGVSAAKGMCYALQIPLLAIDALRSLEQAARLSHPEKVVIPMIDARRMEVYTASYTQHGDLLEPIRPTIIESGVYDHLPEAVFCGDGSFKMKEFLVSEQLIDPEIKPSAAAQIALIWERFQAKQTEDLAYFEPFYLKEYQFGK